MYKYSNNKDIEALRRCEYSLESGSKIKYISRK